VSNPDEVLPVEPAGDVEFGDDEPDDAVDDEDEGRQPSDPST
jgi:hypothetical protein